MSNIFIHTTVLNALQSINEKLRVRILLMVERLCVGIISEQITQEGNLLVIRVGDNLVSRTLYASLEQENIYLLSLSSAREKRPSDQIIAEAQNNRSELIKLYPVTLDALKKVLLNSYEVTLCHKEAILEYSLQQLMQEVNQRSGLTREQLASQLNISALTIARMEKNPLSVSIKNVARYLAIGGAKLDITLKWT